MPNKNGTKTVRELKDTIRKHNQKNCIRLSSNKQALVQRIAQHGLSQQKGTGAPVNNIQNLVKKKKKKKKKKKRIQPTLVSSSTGGSSGNILSGGGAGNSVGQKNFKRKLKKQKKAYKKLGGVDANPELAF